MAPCGVTWRYEIGAFERFFSVCPKICEILGKNSCGTMWRYVALSNWCLFAVFAFFRNL